MLYKCQFNMFSRQCSVYSLLVITLLFPRQAFSTESVDKLQVHGFVAQGLIDVKGSRFVNDDESASAELTEVGINASYQLSDNIRIAGQAVYLNGGNRYTEGFRVDYLLADWSFFTNENWQMNLYVGRFKNYHWLYSSTRDVPMTRPSIILPQSVYFDGTRDMSVGGDGVALTAKYFSDNLGEFDFNISAGPTPLSKAQTRLIMGQFSNGDLTHDEDLQASIYWQPEMSNWRFGLALTDAEFTYTKKGESLFTNGDISLNRYYANAEYHAENWSFSLELLQENMVIDNLLYPTFHRDTTGEGGFVQGEYRWNASTKFLARYEHYYADKNDKQGKKLVAMTQGQVPEYFGYQHDSVLGVTYQISSNLQVQFEHHWIKGTARLTPVVLPDPTANKHEYWQISAIQLTYWF